MSGVRLHLFPICAWAAQQRSAGSSAYRMVRVMSWIFGARSIGP